MNCDMIMYFITNAFVLEFLVWEKVEFTFLARHTEKYPLSVSRGETTEFGSPGIRLTRETAPFSREYQQGLRLPNRRNGYSRSHFSP